MPATLWFAEQRVNTTTAGVQSAASIAKLSNGGFVIVWQDASADAAGDIRAQIYTAAGVQVGGELTIASGATAQTVPEVIGLNSGGFRVSWQTPSGGFGRVFDSAGAPTSAEVLLVSTSSNLRAIVAADGTTAEAAEFNGEIAFVRRQANGLTATSSANAINSTTTGTQTNPDVAALNSGQFVVVWTTSGSEVRFRLVNSSSIPQGAGDVLVNQTTISGVATSRASVTPLSNGGFVITWVSLDGPFPASGRDIRARIYDSAGIPFTDEFIVNSDTAGLQSAAEIVTLSGGGFMITWLDEGSQDIRGQLFDGLGNRNGTTFQVSTNSASQTGAPRILSAALLDDGRVAVAFTGSSGLGDDTGIRLQIIDPREGVVSGNDAGNVLYGGQFADQVTALGGNDTVFGLAGNDVLYAGSGADTVFGDVGDDIVYGGDGADVLNAGTGSDVIYAELANDQVFSELGDDLVFGGDGNDTVNLGAGDDTFYGQNDNDVAFGESGDDAFFLGFGNDTAFTGVGDDVAFGEEGGDTLIGDLGNDVLDGGAGGDVLNGGDGVDNLNGGVDGDILIGGPGGDRLEGGAGGDLYWWQAQNETNDLVVGFNSAEDQLQFTGSQWGGFTAGSSLSNGSTFISSANPNPTGAVPTFLYNNVDGSLFFDPDGTGGAPRIFVALFQGAPALTAGDFQFV